MDKNSITLHTRRLNKEQEKKLVARENWYKQKKNYIEESTENTDKKKTSTKNSKGDYT